jgi:hypothetical protein
MQTKHHSVLFIFDSGEGRDLTGTFDTKYIYKVELYKITQSKCLRQNVVYNSTFVAIHTKYVYKMEPYQNSVKNHARFSCQNVL